MKLLSTYIYLLLLLSLVGSSCVKDIDSFTANGSGPNFQGDVNKMYIELRNSVTPIVTNVPSNTSSKINIGNSNFLIIPPKAWVDKNNKQIKGDVSVSIRLITTKADKIRFAQYSNVSGKIFNWLNNIEILAVSEGNPVLLGVGKSIELYCETDTQYPNLKVYTGSYVSTRKFEVALAQNDTIINTSWVNTFGTIINGYQSKITKTGWSCHGFEVPNSSMNAAAITLPTELRDFNTLVALTGESSDLVINMQPTNPYSSTFKGAIDITDNIRSLCLVDQNKSSKLGILDYFIQLPTETSTTKPVAVTQVAFEELLNGF